MIRAVIVDDEERARRILRNILKQYCSDIEIVAVCANVPDAVVQINRTNPDVVFCDIEMPDYSGFDLLSFFTQVNFEIIFVTAYSEYAINAFEVAAIDYVLKPIQIEKIQAAVEKLQNKLRISSLQHRFDTLKSNFEEENIKRIALPVADGYEFADVNEIILLQAAGAYTYFFLKDRKRHLISKKIGYFERLLESKKTFFRIHRSYIINVNFMQRYQKSDGTVIMDRDVKVKVARDKKRDFEVFLKDEL